MRNDPPPDAGIAETPGMIRWKRDGQKPEQNPDNKRELNQDEMDQISGGRIVAMVPAPNENLNNSLNNNLDSSPSRVNLIAAAVMKKKRPKEP